MVVCAMCGLDSSLITVYDMQINDMPILLCNNDFSNYLKTVQALRAYPSHELTSYGIEILNIYYE